MDVRARPTNLLRSQIEFYGTHGYLIVPDVYTPSACEEIKRAAASFADSDFSVYLNIHRVSGFFLSILKDPVLVGLVKAVQQHKVVGLNDQYLYKKAKTKYAMQSWLPHQDNSAAQAEHGAYIQLHIFLDEHSPDNGGIYYYSGSHEEGILPYNYKHSWQEEIESDGVSRPGWECVVPDSYEKTDVLGPKGGVCLQHGNIIHGSYPNSSLRLDRQQYSIAYLNEGALHTKGKSSPRIPIPVD